MTTPKRILIILALSFGLGAIFSMAGLTPLMVLLGAVPLGIFSWFWILFGDAMPLWAIFTRQGREAVRPILAGNSNLGSAMTLRLSIISEMIRVLQALAIGFMTPILLGLADPVPLAALLFLIVPLIAWWVFAQMRGTS